MWPTILNIDGSYAGLNDDFVVWALRIGPWFLLKGSVKNRLLGFPFA